MIKILLLAILILFLLPAPLILFAALCNISTLKTKSCARNLRELSNAVVSAGTSLFIAVTTRPFTFLDRLPLLRKNRNPHPVLMVHGLYHNKAAWILMKHRLNFQGFDKLQTWQYNSFTRSYPELVLELRKEIRKIYNNTNGQYKVTLLGHSLGGLLISGAVADPEIYNMTKGLITLGTPFKGSALAIAAPGRLGRSLLPDSCLFHGENRIKFPAGLPQTAVISPTDEMVLPWDNLEPDPEQWDIVRCPAMGHVAMLYSRRVTRIVGSTIRKYNEA